MTSDPVQQTPAQQTPAQQTPAQQTPVHQPPAHQPPDRQPASPQPTWRNAPQPPWPGQQAPSPGQQGAWLAAVRPDPPDAQQPAWPATAGTSPPDTQQPACPPSDPPDGQLPHAAAGEGPVAALGYLVVPILGPVVPLVIYLLRRRGSDYARRHSAQALNLSLTVLLYGVCVLIAGGVLALDSTGLGVVVMIAVAAALWLVTLAYAILAGSSANQGRFRRIPAWLCAAIVR